MKYVLLLLVLVANLSFPVYGQLQVAPSGNGITGETCHIYSIGNTSTPVTLTQPSNSFCIINYDPATIVHYSPVSPASVSSVAILPGGGSYCYVGDLRKIIYLYAEAGTVNVGIEAH